MGLCCCKKTPTSCHIKQVICGKTKYGFSPFDININPSNRRWLQYSSTTSWSAPGEGGIVTEVLAINPLSGVQTTVSQTDNGLPRGAIGDLFYNVGGPVPEGATVSYSATTYNYSDTNGYSHIQQLDSEYTDAQVFADMINLVNLIGGWDKIQIDSQVTLNYNSSGQPTTYIDSDSAGPIGCTIPNPFGGGIDIRSDYQVAGAGGRISLNCNFMRFYPGSATDKACILVTYSDAGAGAALPPYANTCSLMSANGSDSNGYYIQIMPTPILVVDDLRYYNTGSFMLNPYTNPNRSSLWTCNCDNLAP